MLDAHPHSEGFGLDAHATAVEQFVNIARRMACGEHHGGAFDQAVAAPHAADAALFDLQVRDAAFEAEHAARIDDRLPDVLHDARQTVGADMRMRLVEYFGRRAVEHERLQRLVIVAALLAAREELAIGEGPGPALAESVVRIGIDGTVAVDLRDVALAGRNIAAALQNHGPQPQFDQPQGGEQPRRPRAHDHHLRTTLDRGIVEMHRSGLRLAVGIDLQREIHLHLPLTGVDRPFHDPHRRDVRVADAHATGCLRGVELRIGGLLGCEREGYLLRHITEFCLQK